MENQKKAEYIVIRDFAHFKEGAVITLSVPCPPGASANVKLHNKNAASPSDKMSENMEKLKKENHNLESKIKDLESKIKDLQEENERVMEVATSSPKK